MKEKIIAYLDEQIEEGEILLKQASGSARECIIGSLNALEGVKEFIEGLDINNV